MTYKQMLTIIEALGADATYYEDDGLICVTLQDFEGFDKDWSAIMRDYDNPEAVKAFKKMLKEQSLRQEDAFYPTYYFKGFGVELGYGSYDI